MSIVGILLALFVAWLLLSSSFSLVNLIISVITWGIAGYIAGQLVIPKKPIGALGYIALGLIGGIVGNFLVRSLGLWGVASAPLVGGIAVGTVGAVVLLVVIGLVIGKR
jgi:uncharacterized membrane protein YeaQ/YmgE (transglycosylase-associated protein family)